MRYAFLILGILAVLVGVCASAASNGEQTTISSKNAAELFRKNCSSCHGRDGRAKTLKAKFNHARNLSDAEWQGRVSDERIFNSIMNGKGKMPPYSKKLSEGEIDSLVTYVRGLKK